MNEETLKNYVEKGIKREIDEQFEILKKKLIEDLDRKKDEITAGILIDVMKTVEMETMGQIVTFRIKKIQ